MIKNQAKLDRELQPLAPEWPLDTIAAIDRNILRIGLYELETRVVPPKVVINEAVELAKAFGSDNSSKFIKGVLGTDFKQLGLSNEEKEHEGTESQVKPESTTSNK